MTAIATPSITIETVVLAPTGAWITFYGDDTPLLEQRRVTPDILLSGWSERVEVEDLALRHLLGLLTEMAAPARAAVAELLGLDLDAWIAEGRKAPPPSMSRQSGVGVLEVSKTLRITNYDDATLPELQVEVQCCGRDGTPDVPGKYWAIDLIHVSRLLDVVIVLAPTMDVEDRTAEEERRRAVYRASFTIGEVLGAVFGELCFHGSPQQTADFVLRFRAWKPDNSASRSRTTSDAESALAEWERERSAREGAQARRLEELRAERRRGGRR